MSPTAGSIRAFRTNDRERSRRTETTGPGLARPAWPIRDRHLAETALLAPVPAPQACPGVGGRAVFPRRARSARALDRSLSVRRDRHDAVPETAIVRAHHGDGRHRPGPLHPPAL